MAEVVMPRLSDSMEEGLIVRWLKAEGDQVARGDELVEIETDKANMVYEADESGVLRIIAAEGDTVAIGAPIAALEGANGAGGGSSAEPEKRDEPASPAAPAPAPATVKAGPPAAAPPARDGSGISASPIARRAAAKLGVALASVRGSGPRGRIFKLDVVQAASGNGEAKLAAALPAPAAAPEPVIGAKGEAEVVELSRLQQTVARRMAQSKATAPHFVLSAEVEMDAALSLRGELKELSSAKPSVNDMIVRASALALRKFPRANGSYENGAFHLHARVNIGIAVAAEDALMVPVVEDADLLPLTRITEASARLADRVRDGSITPPELSGGTFTVSNLGMYGVDSFAGVINPPEAAILCVGAARPRPVVDGEGLRAATVATLTLVCDHRILYGADGAMLLAEIKSNLEIPLSLLT